jgi:type II restriction enzyme
MDLHLDNHISGNYHSQSQRARVITETWMRRNMYCPVCGREHLVQFEANRPVADFYCENCQQEYELKSKEGHTLGTRITDGAYDTMIDRITSNNNPNLFFMTHSTDTVNNLILIPRYFFTPSLIEPRKPLKETARRAGWIGCNINLTTIPPSCTIEIVKGGLVNDVEAVVSKYQKIRALQIDNIDSRGWMLDVLFCVNQLPEVFQLNQVYQFESHLAGKHPDNNHIQAKIRQQLQYLRDKGLIEFIGRGIYRRHL